MQSLFDKVLTVSIQRSPAVRNFCRRFFSTNVKVKHLLLRFEFLEKSIRNFYPEESLRQKRFYNIGAGSQRSRFGFWSYVDLKTSDYEKSGIDIFFDLESLEPLPLERDMAEVIFSSFVIEHISKEATKNFCKEAFKALKKGGVFHSKVHCYEYGLRLLRHGLLSPKIPFECRESHMELDAFIKKHKGKVSAEFGQDGEYVVRSDEEPSNRVAFSPSDGFLFHNATSTLSAVKERHGEASGLMDELKERRTGDVYKVLKEGYVDKAKRQPHQHNADYFSKEELYEYIKGLGFSEVYFTQPYQSVSPVLWEDKLNHTHEGFLFSIEAIK
ncbi:hypothetical protein FUAX_34940 [Fulvitalea axinellae]|uniref:Methyltransferase type 11 domain-containing protein n=1 Tax=Fulvitalea axinellae TaxID=1182444 RepID=A0AAU9D055_9BACT|nr:hypothetical protein FUAX_34940 [Fulvitalea axinellae]